MSKLAHSNQPTMDEIEKRRLAEAGYKIVTRHFPKPTPIRSFDWEATEDDYDLGRPVGYGRTEAEAIADLMEQVEAIQS